MFATLLGALPDHPDARSPDEAAREAITEQEAAGLEPLVDGHGPVAAGADTVAAWQAAATWTSRATKQALIGPMTASAARDRAAVEVAEELNETIRELVAAGCPLIEIHEPEAVRLGDDVAALTMFADAHRRLSDGVAGTVHLSLAVTGGSVPTAATATLFDLPYASYAFDLIAGPDNWRLIAEAPVDRGIICGALDASAASSDRPETLIWAAHYAASTRGRGLVRVGLANASSLGALDHGRAVAKLKALGDAARLAAVESPEELAAAIDPRAVDIRSAATGRFDPSAPRRPGRG